MHDNWMAYIAVLLTIFPTFSCSKHREKNGLCIKDRNLVIHTVMSDAANASINCPNLEANQKSVQITLYMETQLHFTDFQKTHVENTSMEKQRFSVHVRNDTVEYVIDMPHVNDTGLYTCTVAQHEHGIAVKRERKTFLLVTDPGLQSCPHEGQSVFWLLLVVGCGLLALYNFIITAVSCSYAWKLRHQDTYQSDYFNTRPGEFGKAK